MANIPPSLRVNLPEKSHQKWIKIPEADQTLIIVLLASSFALSPIARESRADSLTGTTANSQSVATEQPAGDNKKKRTLVPSEVLVLASLALTVVPILIGLVILIMVVHSRGAERFEPFFGQGQLAQLVVILLIAGNVCSLAFAGLMDASEVSAIYGGIVGYVLGRQFRRRDQNNAEEAGGGD